GGLEQTVVDRGGQAAAFGGARAEQVIAHPEPGAEGARHRIVDARGEREGSGRRVGDEQPSVADREVAAEALELDGTRGRGREHDQGEDEPRGTEHRNRASAHAVLPYATC